MDLQDYDLKECWDFHLYSSDIAKIWFLIYITVISFINFCDNKESLDFFFLKINQSFI